MNNQLQNPIYFNQILENTISDWKKQTSAQVREKAKMYASKKLPKAKEDKLNRYIGFFEEKAKHCVSEIERILKVTPSIFGLKQMKDKRDDIVFQLEAQKEGIQSKLLALTPMQNNGESKFIKIQSIGLLILLLLFAVAEGYLSYKPFCFITGSHIGSLIISIVFAIIWAIAAEKFPHWFNSREGFKRKLKRILLLVGFTTIFYAIAHLRVLERISIRAILNEEPIPNFWDINIIEVLILTSIGWLFFLGGMWISQYAPNYTDMKQAILDYFNKKKIKELKSKLEEIDNQILCENEKIAQEEYKVLSLLNLRKQAIEDVKNYMKYMLEEFKDTNLTYRVDAVYPECFNEEYDFNIDTVLPDLKKDLENQI